MEIQEMKQVFIRSAVRVVARDGLEKTTTKAIAKEAKLNEAYIYKCFTGKEQLLSEALYIEDAGLSRLLRETMPVMKMEILPWKDRAFILWQKVWALILSEPDDCIFYIRFYFNALCSGTVYRDHLKEYQPIIDQVTPSFKPGVNVDMVVHQIFSTMLFFASWVMTGELKDCEETTRWTFEQICCFVVPNLLPEVVGEIVPSPPHTCPWFTNMPEVEPHQAETLPA